MAPTFGRFADWRSTQCPASTRGSTPTTRTQDLWSTGSPQRSFGGVVEIRRLHDWIAGGDE